MIIDSLVHITPNGKWFDTDYDASESKLLHDLDKEKVERAVLVGLAGYISNEFILDVCKRNKGRLIPGASFNPSQYTNATVAVRQFRTEVLNKGFEVLKLHPRFNKFDPLSPVCCAILSEISDWEKPLPVWLDSFLYSKDFNLQKPLIDTIHYLVTTFNKINFVILHGAGSYILPLMESLRDCPNAFIDVSYTMCKYIGSSVTSDMAYLFNRFDRKIIYGSDFPEISIRESLSTFTTVTQKLDSNKKSNILGINLSNILYGK